MIAGIFLAIAIYLLWPVLGVFLYLGLEFLEIVGYFWDEAFKRH